MKLEERADNIEMNGIGKVSAFNIALTAQSFDILSSTLYSDQCGAIIREIGTNAFDSQIQAGKPECQFEVKLPNPLDNSFYIRDFGLGLSEDDVRNVYTSYFTSTKTQSNDTVGCFGLGSKTPFCYTDNFTVVSYQDGHETSYAIFRNEEGLPCFTKMGTRKTNEPNGLKVTFPVAQKDFGRFKDTVEKVYYWFDPQPNIIGMEKIPAPLFVSEKTMANDNWTLHQNPNYRNVYILMGNVLYPCNKVCNEGCLVIKAKIGDVDITASREDLKYTKKTEDFLGKNIKKYNEEKYKIFEEELQKCSCLYDARVFARQSPNFVNNNTKYKGTPIKCKDSYYNDIFVRIEDREKFGEVYKCSSRYRKGSYRFSNELTNVFNYYGTETLIVEYKEKSKYVDKKILHRMREKECNIYSVKFDKPEQKVAFLEIIGLPADRLIDIESLPKPPATPKNPSSVARIKKTQIKKYVHTHAFYAGTSLVNVDYEDTLEGYYVNGDYNYDSWFDIHNFLKKVDRLEEKFPNIYIVKSNFDISNGKLKPFDDYKNVLLKKYEKEKDVVKYYKHHEKLASYYLLKDVLKEDEKKEVEICCKIRKNSVFYRSLNVLFNEDYTPTWLDKYPLLRYINGISYMTKDGKDIDHVKEYINLINGKNN